MNTYSPRPTRLEQFRNRELCTGDEVLVRHASSRSVLGGFIAAGAVDPVPIFSAAAWPAAPPDAATTSALLGALDSALDRQSGLAGVLLDLHGAMVCEGEPDMDLRVLRTIRARLGDLPVACVLDPHGLPSAAFADECDAVLAYDTYPHVDMWDRGREAARLMREMVDGRKLCSRASKLPLLTSPVAQATGREPMRSLQRKASEMARLVGALRVSLLPGFPYSDVDRAGFSVLGIADRQRLPALESLVDEIAEVVESRGDDFALERDNVAAAVAKACRAKETPVVLVDIGDNVGGGSAGDGTALLHELLSVGGPNAIVTIADSEVARLACQEGVGARIDASVGGKLDARHGAPVHIEGEVLKTGDGAYLSQGPYLAGLEFSTGRSAVIRIGSIRLIVTERSVPPFHVEQLTSLGLDPSEAHIITAKSVHAWRAAFGDLAGEVIEVDTPGVTPLDPAVLPRRTRPVRDEARRSHP